MVALDPFMLVCVTQIFAMTQRTNKSAEEEKLPRGQDEQQEEISLLEDLQLPLPGTSSPEDRT